jgi:hypothetical protein
MTGGIYIVSAAAAMQDRAGLLSLRCLGHAVGACALRDTPAAPGAQTVSSIQAASAAQLWVHLFGFHSDLKGHGVDDSHHVMAGLPGMASTLSATSMTLALQMASGMAV